MDCCCRVAHIVVRRHLRSASHHYLTSTLPAEYLWSSGLLCYWPGNLKLSTGQPPWPGAQQWQF